MQRVSHVAPCAAKGRVHSPQLNGSEWPHVVSGEKGKRKKESLEINRKQKMDGRKEMYTWRRKKVLLKH